MGKSLAQPEDGGNPLLPVLKLALVCYGSDFGGADFVQRCERIAKNAAENEPFFFMTAITGGLAGLIPCGLGCQLALAYTGCRIGHAVTYILGPKITTAPRSFTWISGAVISLGVSGIILSKTKGAIEL
eukprot:CAMPEP_0114520836 /NCGR_PEP_ID=MMETSP0109-20121206/19844_1 /TAXON_ID=29199 /ORGANISM="Chlorarachnion reptans, Strain CCCM449" /LENGTH=128 /DNA_ID=CAMNT_0001701859 /DNA_START=90 /DNA_END=476 /DNA_ORIENTATION=+